MKEKKFTITKAEPSDIPRMAALINSVYRGQPSKAGWTTEADIIAGDLRTDEADLTGLMAAETSCFLKCVEDLAGLVGTVYLDKQRDRLYLGMLSVDVAWQASGIGKRLLMAAEDHAKEIGCRAITMQVIPIRLELMAWYEKYGYQATGERKPFIGDTRFGVPKVPIDFVVLEKPMH